MKALLVTILSIMSLSLTVQAQERQVLSDAQAKKIALIHARAFFAGDDVSAIVHGADEAKYEIISFQHRGDDIFQVDIKRSGQGGACTQSLILNDSTGDLDFKSDVKCGQ